MIAIKDMEEMPSCCYECPYFDDYCALTGKWESDTEQIRDNDCPLVEIRREKMICKYCGKEIPKSEVWNPDENGNGYHHRCLIDMEFDENETYIKNLKMKDRSIIIPDNATNGDMIMTMFNCMVIEVSKSKVYVEHIYFPFDKVWWNAPYNKEVEE